MTDKLLRPSHNDALHQISLISGIGDDDEYYPLRVTPSGNIQVEMLEWNTSTLAWEAYTGADVTLNISDNPFGISWDGVADTAPSKNAVYDELISHYALTTGIHGLAITPGKVLTVQNNVTITGPLGSAAYTALTAYEAAGAIAAHAALQNVHGLNITSGKTLTVQDNVTITGALGSAAYTAATAYDASGAANTAVSNHAALLTGVHGLAITAGKVLTVQDNVTITGALGTGAYATIANYAPLASPTFTGQVLIPSGLLTSPGLALSANAGTGFVNYYGGTQIGIVLNGTLEAVFGASFLNLEKDNYFIQLGTSQDVVFGRDTANTLALKNGNAAYGLIRSKQELVTTTAAATALTSETFIPDGAVPLSISTYVQTSILGGAATGYIVGDGVDPDRWGSVTGTAVGTLTDNTYWTATTVQAFTAAQAITLTALTGNFPAGGKIRVCMTYMSGSPPTS
jgi:hypothetical protein